MHCQCGSGGRLTVRLCITADDYGLCPEVNASIEELAARKHIQSTSVMVHNGAVLGSVATLKSLGVCTGLHIVFVGERPLLGSRLEPLLDGEGYLVDNYTLLFGRILKHPHLISILVEEAHAQVDRFVSLGLSLDFFNSHQHVHQFPLLWRALREVFSRMPKAAVRCAKGPVEPTRQGLVNLAAKISWWAWPLPHSIVLDPVGVDYAGHLSLVAVERVLRALKKRNRRIGSLPELVAHPGFGLPSRLSHRSWNYQWLEEHNTLASSEIRELFNRYQVNLVSPGSQLRAINENK